MICKTWKFLQLTLREPLLHFVVAAGLVFLAFSLVEGPDREDRDITITREHVEQLAAVFSSTWQRPPADQEVKALIDDYVREEILVREALRLGLDQGDTVIRRRLRQKMEFMQEAEAAALTPAAGELEAYFEANKAGFEKEPQLALEQVFIDPRKHGDATDAAVATMIQRLQADTNIQMSELGDPSMLPQSVQLSPLSTIKSIFGPAFGEMVATLPVGQLSAPVKSEYGVHIVRITRRENGETPELADVRDAVLRQWREAKQAEMLRERLDALLKSYRVTIESGAGAGNP